jgi:hypothetical protein
MTNLTNSRWLNRGLALVLLLFIFAAGLGVGWGLARWNDAPRVGQTTSGPREFGPRRYHRLGLSPEQQRAVNAIYEKHRDTLDAILDETTPRVRAVHDQIEQEIRALLTPAQMERLERQDQRRQTRRQGRGLRRGDGMGPGRGRGRMPDPGFGPGSPP